MERDDNLEAPQIHGGLFDTITRFIGGGSSDATKKTFEAAIPTAMLALAHHGSTERGAQGLLDGMRDGRFPQLDAQDIGRTLGDPQASDRLMASSGGMLEHLLGGRMGGVLDGLSSHGGLGRGGSSKLLALAAPLALAVIGKRAREGQHDARGLSGFLLTQTSRVAMLVPPSIARSFGFEGAPPARPTGETHEGEVEPRPRAVRTEEPSYRGARAGGERHEGRHHWGWLALALAAILGVGWAVSRALRPEAPQLATRGAPSTTFGRRGAAPFTRQGRASMGSTSEGIRSIQGYLSSSDTQPKSFVLDGLGFEHDQSVLTAGGRQVTDDLAAQLNAHPDAKARIEGFTDSTGNAAANVELSTARAREVKQRLVDRGVAPDRVEAVGLGEAKPIARNDTEEGRARNRRVEVQLSR
jgi:outer membrane protein OmpA-like peptidoglycan-associated protein